MSGADTSQRRCSRCSTRNRACARQVCSAAIEVCWVWLRVPPWSMSPMTMESSTVVMPAAAHCASCVTVADTAFHNTPGRGTKCFSRLSVCSSTRPASNQSPPQSSACGSDVPLRSTDRIAAPSMTTQPMNSSVAVTTRALLMIR